MKLAIQNLHQLRNNPLIKALYTFIKKHRIELYLVGGSVRDLLLNRPITDFDFTSETNAFQYAKMFADSIHAPIIPLEEDPPTARIIIKNTDAMLPVFYIDFAQYRAASLIEDLQLRDLTINAIAIPFVPFMKSDKYEIIDPCDGIKDLEMHLLRFPSEQVILDDPLRLMRIYRFAAQLDFHITEKSETLVEKHKQLLPEVSIERVRDELLKVLNVENAQKYLQQMSEIGLLSTVLPQLEQRSINWNPLKYYEEELIPNEIGDYDIEMQIYLHDELGLNTSRVSLIKLCLLLVEDFSDAGNKLRLSKKAVKFMKCLFAGYRHISDNSMTKKDIIDFLRIASTDWWGVILYSKALQSISPESIKKISETYFNHFLPILEQGRLITGADLIQRYNLKEGKTIGELLKQIEDMQFYGEIQTREEALAAVEELIRERDFTI